MCDRYGIDNSHRTLHGALLDAEILADVYLLMTGGQTKLNLASETSESETSQDTGIRRLESNRPPLRVVRASDEVAAVREARLDLVQKKEVPACGGNEIALGAAAAGLPPGRGQRGVCAFRHSSARQPLSHRLRREGDHLHHQAQAGDAFGDPGATRWQQALCGQGQAARRGLVAPQDQDLITIRDPMPGPWQAIGEVDPDNRVRLLTDIQVERAATGPPLSG